MSNSLASRFQLVVDQLTKGNKKQFSELTGKSSSHIYKICKGKSRPSMAYLQELYDNFQIDLNWLLTGQESEGSSVTGSVNSNDLVHAPMFDVQASAGAGMTVNSEEITENFAFNKHWLSSQLGVHSEQVAFVTVSGDSMLPTLEEGDMILVDMSQQQVQREGIYLLQTEGGLITKRLINKKVGELEVISDNSDYPSWTIDAQNSEQTQIAGKVVWSARAL